MRGKGPSCNRLWRRGTLWLLACLLVFSIAGPSAGRNAGHEGIRLPTLTVTGQKRFLLMPQRAPVVREELALVANSLCLRPRVQRLLAFPDVRLEPVRGLPRSGGCLFGSRLASSVASLFSPETALFRYSLSLYRAGKLAQSDARLERLITRYPGSRYVPEALFWRAQIAIQAGRLSQASSLLQELVDRFSGHPRREEALCNLAYAKHKLGRDRDCIAVLREIVGQYPQSSRAEAAKHSLGALLFKQGRYAEAAEVFGELSSSASSDETRDQYVFWQAESLYLAGRPKSAVALCARSVEDFGAGRLKPWLLWTWALSLRRLGQVSKASALLSTIVDSFPESKVAPAALFEQARTLVDRRKFRAARDAFADLAQRFRTSPYLCPSLVMLASLELRLGRTEVSKSWLMQAEQLCAADADLHSRVQYHLGLAMAASDNLDEAGSRFGLAADLATDPGVKAASLLGGGWYQFRRGNYRKAASLFDRAASLKSPGDVHNEAAFWAGQSYLALGKTAEAIERFNELLTGPGVPRSLALDAHLGIGLSLVYEKRWGDAMRHFRLITTTTRPKEERASCWLNMAQCAYNLDEYEKGLRYASNAADLAASPSVRCQAGYVLARCLARLGQRERALRLLGSLPQRFPRCDFLDEAKLAMGTILFEDGRFKEAAKRFKELISTFPESPLVPDAFLGVADSLYNRADHAGAADYYEKVLTRTAPQAEQKAALYGLILCYQRQGDLEELETKVEEFINRFEDMRMSATLRSLLAEELAQRKQYFGAIRQYSKAAYYLEKAGAPRAQIDKVLYRKGQIMEMTGDIRGAISEYDQLLVPARENRFVRLAKLRRAELYARLGRTKKALAILSKLAEEYHDDRQIAGSALIHMAELVQRTDRPKAISFCDEAQRRFPMTQVAAKANLFAARLLIEQSSFSQARGRLRASMESAQDEETKAHALYLLGHSLFLEGRFDDASGTLMRVRYLYPRSKWAPLAMLEAARSLVKMGKPGEAAKVFRAVIRDYPDRKQVAEEARADMKSLPAGAR